jgi:hypothetical protein
VAELIINTQDLASGVVRIEGFAYNSVVCPIIVPRATLCLALLLRLHRLIAFAIVNFPSSAALSFSLFLALLLHNPSPFAAQPQTLALQ